MTSRDAVRFLAPFALAAGLAACSGGATNATLPSVSAGAPAGAGSAEQLQARRRSPGASPSPSASSSPAANAPAAQIISASGGCGSAPSLQNGVEYGTDWAPYSCDSPLNRRISSNPSVASYSDAAIAAAFGNGNTQPVRDSEAGAYDVGHPVFYSSSSDPTVRLDCTSYCNTSDNGGYPSSIHIPAKARPARGGDGHIAIVQPDGSEIDAWAASQPSGDWGSDGNTTLSAGAVANCGSFYSGSGFLPNGPAATAGGSCLGAGLLRANELRNGSINHALALGSQCAVGTQFPAFSYASTDRCSSGVGAPLGGRLWYDVADDTTNANPNLQPWEKAILNALHDYGGYLMDDLGGGAGQSGILFLAESGESALDFGQPDPFAALTGQGWHPISISGGLQSRYEGADPWRPSGVDFAAHLHWLAPCSAQGGC